MSSDMIKKFWLYPNLRQQIPNMIDNARKKFFKLQDAAYRAENDWHEMEREYSHLLAVEAREARERKM